MRCCRQDASQGMEVIRMSSHTVRLLTLSTPPSSYALSFCPCEDADWLLFQSGDYTTLFQQKTWP